MHRLEIESKKSVEKLKINPAESILTCDLERSQNTPVQFSIYQSIHHINTAWKAIAPDKLFFSPTFLSLIEEHPPDGLEQLYIIFHKHQNAIGGAVIQIKKVSLNQSMNFEEGKGKETASPGNSNLLKSTVSRMLKMDTLICGNVLLTGEYGFFFQDTYSYKEQFEMIESCLTISSKKLRSLGYRISPILMKDYYVDKKFENQNIENSGFTEFSVQPNMILEIDSDWNSFDDYLNAIKSKYRVRYKRAVKKASEIQKKELDFDRIVELNDRIYNLYLETAQVAGFNLFTLPQDYFIHLKSYLKDQVKIVGYFLDETLIGYYTIVIDGDFMEAHYLGYDKSKNAQYQSYLNMLYDLVKEGIELGAQKIQFARTALEIKSSIGAQPKEMYCYLTSNKKFVNLFLPKVLNWFVPEEEWLARQPFKEKLN